MVPTHRFIIFVEVETKEKWQEPAYYIRMAERTMREVAEDLGNFTIWFSHSIEVKDRGLYHLLYELVTKLAYGKKMKKRV